MSIVRLQTFLTAVNPQSKFPRQFWLSLSLALAAFYGCQVLQQAFSSEYVASDDARQHIFWMQRFLDSQLFPKDLIADYFQSVAPIGYSTFYHFFAVLGIQPLLLSKILPLFLGMVATGYCFALCVEFFPVPSAGFIASLLFQQNLWMWDDLASATPRAFLHPIFLAFLYYFVRKSFVPCWVAIALLGGFYPQYVLVASGVIFLSLLSWKKGRIKWRGDTPTESLRERRELQFYLSCLTVAFAVILAYALKSSEFSPTITAAEAKLLPEFLPGGRAIFFNEDFGRFWLTGERSGIQPTLDPPLLCAGFLLPLILGLGSRFSIVRDIRPSICVLLNLLISSFFWFFTAHMLLFKLHLPGRYTHHSLRVILSIAAAITLVVFIDSLLKWVKSRSTSYQVGSICILLFTFGYLICYPTSLSDYPKTNYEKIGKYPELYHFFERQSKDITIASLSLEASNIPLFSHRSILSGYEYAIPYHLGYYNRFRERTFATIEAQYTPNLDKLKQFIRKYEIDFWVLDDRAFEVNYLKENPWVGQYSDLADVKKILKRTTKEIPALEALAQQCTSDRFGNILVVPSSCILQADKAYNLLK